MRTTLLASLCLAIFTLPLQAGGIDGSLVTSPEGDATAVASSPTVPGLTLMGITDLTWGQKGDVYRSTDGGATWAKTSLAEPLVNSVFDLEFAPDGTAFAGTNSNLWKSSDDGVTWSLVPTWSSSDPRIHEIQFVSGSSTDLWIGVGTPAPALMHSVDGGATWTWPNLPYMPMFFKCEGIAITPAAPGLIAAAFSSFMDGSRVLISTDGGTTWANKSGVLVMANLTGFSTDGSKLWAASDVPGFGMQSGLSYSTDFGQTWNELLDPSRPTPLFASIHVDPLSPSTIYLGLAGSGVYRSSDAGATWATSLAGTEEVTIEKIESKPGSHGLVVGTRSHGFVQSSDGLAFSVAPISGSAGGTSRSRSTWGRG
jgi:photosystem II stability/assembly factor-like uncharacterized protein